MAKEKKRNKLLFCNLHPVHHKFHHRPDCLQITTHASKEVGSMNKAMAYNVLHQNGPYTLTPNSEI